MFVFVFAGYFYMVVRCFSTLFLLVDRRYLKQAVDPLGLCTPYIQTPFSHLPTSHASLQERLKAVIGCHRLKAVIGQLGFLMTVMMFLEGYRL